MSTTAKKAVLRALVEGALTDLMVKTQADNVYLDDTTTLAAKLSEMITAINEKAKSADVAAQISAAIDGLISGAPATYDTLKEIADYISNHEDVVATLNAAIGNKADAATVTALQDVVNALGDLASKDQVGESDLDAALAAKINTAAEGGHSHANKAVLDAITEDRAAEWDSKGTVFVQTNQPANLAAGDLWIQILE